MLLEHPVFPSLCNATSAHYICIVKHQKNMVTSSLKDASATYLAPEPEKGHAFPYGISLEYMPQHYVLVGPDRKHPTHDSLDPFQWMVGCLKGALIGFT